MFAEVAQNLFAIPGGFLVTAQDLRDSLEVEELRERWLRTRQKQMVQICATSAKYVFDDGQIFSGIPESLRRACVELSAIGANRHAVWEFHAAYGQVRRGVPTFGKEWEQGDGLSRDARSDDAESRKSDGSDAERAECRSSDSADMKAGLHAQSLVDIHLPREVLTNHVASYLGRPPNLEVGWTTSSPATGQTPHWNGKEVKGLSWSGHLSSFGLSETAALLEGIERRIGALESEPQSILGKGSELDGIVLTPMDFPPYPAAFYGAIGAEYSADQPHEWVRVTRLNDGEKAWLPREYVYYGQQMKHRLWALSTSSGCATGSTIAEAQLFGVLELIERDSFVGCWYAGINANPIDLDSILDLRKLRARASLLGIELECGLLPSIIGIPVVVSSARISDDIGSVLAIGASCHPDMSQAAIGAINEVWTYINERTTFAQSHRDRIECLHADPTLCADIADHPLLSIYATERAYLEFIGTDASDSIPADSDWQNWSERTADELLDHVVARLHTEGVDVWTHRQTSRFERSLGLETVMTVSPDLLPIDFGWKQQRALQSKRLRRIIEKYHGTHAQPRLLPHPFS